MLPAPTSLNDWLTRLESLHPKAIDMGLERVAAVGRSLGLQFDCPVITVAGTNGKGSTCAMLEAMLLQGGYRVGLSTSPHLLDFNERARINGEIATDAMLCDSFAVVEAARGEMPGIAARYGELSLPVGIMFAAGDLLLDPAVHGQPTVAATGSGAGRSRDGGTMTPAEPAMGSTMTAAMLLASCRAIRRGRDMILFFWRTLRRGDRDLERFPPNLMVFIKLEALLQWCEIF